MRQQYRYKQLGKKSSLTDDRIDLLNSIGFVWKMQGGRRKKSDPVARPNQNGSPGMESTMSMSDSTTGETPIKCKPFVLDPMSSPAVGTTTSYIPPPPVTMIKQECTFGHPTSI